MFLLADCCTALLYLFAQFTSVCIRTASISCQICRTPIDSKFCILNHHHLQNETTADGLLHCALQSSWPAGQYAAAVVTVHLAFALLEKQRLENFEEKGEVYICIYDVYVCIYMYI